LSYQLVTDSWRLVAEVLGLGLEDLAGLKLVEREKITGVRGDRWSLTDETRIRLQQLPENIENDDVDEQ
jgi:hypothetical protein